MSIFSIFFGGSHPYLAIVTNPSILSWIQMLIWIRLPPQSCQH